MSEVVKKISEKGIKEEVPGNHPIYLSDALSLFFLEKGSVNLFAIRRKNGRPEGPRSLITTLNAPALLFGFSIDKESPYEIIAITEQESCIWHIALQDVESEIEKDPTFVHLWIHHLADLYKKESCQEKQFYLEPFQPTQIEKSNVLTSKRAITHQEKSKIKWIEIESGEVDFLGYPSLGISKGYFPLTYTAWVKTRTETVITEHEFTKEWKSGLFNLHRILFAYVDLRQQIDDIQNKLLAQKRFEKEEEGIHLSLEEMASVLNPLEPAVMTGSFDPLFKACQLVASHLNIPIQMPSEVPEGKNMIHHLKAIADRSSIRYRQVRLVGTWWKKSCGPLVAFQGPEFKPVALLEKRPGRYVMIDPDSQIHTPVDKNIAATLSKIGFCFYPTFSDDLKTGKDVLKFHLKHSAKEYGPLIFYSCIAALISLFPPFATKILFSRVIPGADRPLLIQIAISLFLAAASSSAFFFFRSMAVARIEGQSANQLQTALWDRLLKLPVSFFRKYASGTLILHVISSDRMRALLSGNAARILFSGVFSVLYIIAMLIYAPSLTLLVIGILLISFIISLACFILYAKMQRKVFELEAKLNSFITQIISSVSKLRVAGAEKNAYSNWAHEFAKYQKMGLNSHHVYNIILGLNYILPLVMYLMIFTYIIKWTSGYSVGSFLAFNTAFMSFYIAIIDLSNTMLKMVPILTHWDRTKLIIQEPLEETSKAKKPGILTGEIHVDEIFFKYEEGDAYILNNVSLKANPKEFIGIVGPSGCGKSTLIRLLLGFEKPTSGAIYFDNKNINSISIPDFRRQLGVVLQEEGIIAGSIYDNIACGGTYSPEQVEKALINSGLSEDVEAMPMGLHTYLSIGGGTLSGGQKQRLLIARALLPNPKILLLDEATSALDNRNQEKVLACIDQLDVTRIVIAHRLTTLKNADRIYVMEKGQFAQVGTYDELSSQPGPFANMLKRQSL